MRKEKQRYFSGKSRLHHKNTLLYLNIVHINDHLTYYMYIQHDHEPSFRALGGGEKSPLDESFDILYSTSRDAAFPTKAHPKRLKVSLNKKEEKAGIPFPIKLHVMLDNAHESGFTNIVSWERDGRAFKVHDSDSFVATVLPHYVNQTRYKSFQRQLNIYGFERVSKGKDKGLIYHKLFVRGDRPLCHLMERTKLKSSSLKPELLTLKAHTNKAEEDDKLTDLQHSLSDNEVCSSAEPVAVSGSVVSDDDISEDDCLDIFGGKLFYPVDDDELALDEQQEHPPEVTSITRPRRLRSVSDAESPVLCGKAAAPDTDSNAITISSSTSVSGATTTSSISRAMITTTTTSRSSTGRQQHESFPWKLYDLLEKVAANGQEHIVSWQREGRALKVHKPKEFASLILPVYFLHSTTKWASFQRQLSLYGFQRIARGPLKGMYYHKFFVRETRSLCGQIFRPR
jgi:hypothetical protein